MGKVVKLRQSVSIRTPAEICLAIKENRFDFKTLTVPERDACIEYLYESQGFNQSEIATILRISRRTVWRRIQRFDTQRALELSIRGVDSYQLAQRLIMTTAYVKSRAREKEDYRLMMDAEHKLKDALQDLGVVYKAPLQIQVEQNQKISIQCEIINNERLGEVIDILADAGIIERQAIGN